VKDDEDGQRTGYIPWRIQIQMKLFAAAVAIDDAMLFTHRVGRWSGVRGGRLFRLCRTARSRRRWEVSVGGARTQRGAANRRQRHGQEEATISETGIRHALHRLLRKIKEKERETGD
jgi:hypothetical protein